MKKILFAILGLILSFATANAQSPLKVFSSPKLPARETLDRMNLTLAWNLRVPVDGNRDGIFTLQLIPGTPNQLVAQTYKGAVHLYDADNGDLIWKTMVGTAYWASQPVGFNSQSIFVTRRDRLHILNRQTGAQRVYSFDPGSNDPLFGVDLQFTPSAPPVADEEFLFVCLGGRVNAYVIPDFDAFEKIKRAREAAKKADPTGEKTDPTKEEKLRYYDELPPPESRDTLQPILYWTYVIPDQTLAFAPLFSGDQISFLTNNGVLTSINRYDQGPRIENFEFKFNGGTLGGAAQSGRIAYVGSEDFNLYAVELTGGKLLWRHLSGAPIPRKPNVLDREVFLSPTGVGLRSLDRQSGRENWTNRETQAFLATNNQYVYARDRVGRFFVLDARRGATLAKVDFFDWTIAMANEWTDRIYLAANDGQIMCLRHRDLAKPLIVKSFEPVPAPKDVKKKDEKKDDEKKEEEKKDDKEKKDAARRGDLPSSVHPRLVMSARPATAFDDVHRTRALR